MNKHKHTEGQTLVALLVFMVIAVSIISASVVVVIMNSRAASGREQGIIALQIANSGAENALLRLIRNPSYVGETLTIGSGTAIITVSGSDPKTIISEGQTGNYHRKVQVVASGSAFLVVSSWKEIQ